MWATTNKCRCALQKFHVTDSQNKCDQITSDRRSKCVWSNCVQCIQLILSGSPHECWLHTCNACIIKTWWLGLQAPHVPAKNRIILISQTVPQTWGNQEDLSNFWKKEFKREIACSQYKNKIIETNGLTKVASIVTWGWILQRAFCKRKILAANINTFLLNTLRRNEETWWWRPSQIITFVKFCSSICCVLFSSCSKNR